MPYNSGPSGPESAKYQHPRARGGYVEEAAYDSYTNPEPSIWSGLKDPTNAE